MQIVKDKGKANYPFVVEYKNVFGNWCSQSASRSLAAQLEIAEKFKERNPTMKVRVKHYTGGPSDA